MKKLPKADYDSPWKEAIGLYFESFLEFFFPHIWADIDWSQGYTMLDKELQKIVGSAALGVSRSHSRALQPGGVQPGHFGG